MDFKTKEKAFNFGEKMLKEINHPQDWKINVWENSGIHVSLNNKHKKIMIIPNIEDDDVVYHVYASRDFMGCDDPEFISDSSKDINESLRLKFIEVENTKTKLGKLHKELLKYKESKDGTRK